MQVVLQLAAGTPSSQGSAWDSHRGIVLRQPRDAFASGIKSATWTRHQRPCGPCCHGSYLAGVYQHRIHIQLADLVHQHGDPQVPPAEVRSENDEISAEESDACIHMRAPTRDSPRLEDVIHYRRLAAPKESSEDQSGRC